MTRRLVLLVSLLQAVAACSDSRPQPAKAQLPTVATEDLAVYAAVLDSLYMRDERVDTIFVHRLAVAVPSKRDENQSTAALQTQLERLQEVPRDAIRDFLRANARDAVIRDSLPLSRPHRLTDPSGVGPIPDHPAPYSFEFSRVGYSSSRNYALVTVIFHCIICGEGQSVLLVREAGRWRVVEAFVDWVS